MSNFIYACGDPANGRIHVGHMVYMSGVAESVVIDEVKREHPGCQGVILINADKRPGGQEQGVDVALDLDGVCDRINVLAYNTISRQFQGNVYTLDLTVNQFLRTIGAMLEDGTAAVMDVSLNAKDSETPEGMIGYVDALNYYFSPDALFDAVAQYAAERNLDVAWMGRAGTYQALRKLGIVQQVGSDGKTTRMKRTPDGKTQRLLWIPRQYVDETMQSRYEL